MQPATHPRPVRVIVEIDPGQVSSLLAQLVDRFTPTRATSAPPRPDPDDDEDADEPEERPADPPPLTGNLPLQVASSHPMPALPAHLARHRYLGALCKHGHDYAHSGYGLRKKSNHGCVVCERERDLVRKQARQTPQRAVVTALPPPTGTRPVLPAHLAVTCFLSPIPCQNATHRYRETLYTLRDLADERCTQCVMQTSQQTLAGD